MQELKLFENRLEQIATTLDGLMDRINSVEARLKEVTEGSVLYVDADKALVSSRPEDLAFMRDQIRAGNPRFKEYAK